MDLCTWLSTEVKVSGFTEQPKSEINSEDIYDLGSLQLAIEVTHICQGRRLKNMPGGALKIY